MLSLLIGGLVIFVYSITRLSAVMKELFTEKAKESIQKYTSNIYAGILIGTLCTFAVNSSSAVIIMTIVFINAKSLDFKRAMGIIMGANIGTTLSSQLFALNIAQYSVIPLLLGLVLIVFFRKYKWGRYGNMLFFIGLLFFGLFVMQESVQPLQESQLFEKWILRVENNHIYGALVGGLITLILQTSSGTVGMTIVMGKKGLIGLTGGIAIMLGAELGTCSDTLIATINGSRQAIKAGVFHLLFNLITILIGLIAFSGFLSMVIALTPNQEIDNRIAIAHMVFNICGVLLVLPFAGVFKRFLDRLLPEKPRTGP